MGGGGQVGGQVGGVSWEVRWRGGWDQVGVVRWESRWVGLAGRGQVGDQLGNRGRVSWGSGGGQLLTPGVMYLCPVHVPGERVRSLPAEDVHLLPVVFGEVPQLSQPGNAVKVSSAPGPAPPDSSCADYPECIRSDSHQQHQLLHVCARRLRHPGGERPARGNHQRGGGLRAVPGEGEAWAGPAAAQLLCVSRPLTLTPFLRLLPLKILIVTSTAFAGVMLLNYQRDYTEWLLPLVIVCLFSFLVAHCFLSIFEIVVDVLFLCFAIDTKYNDGTPGKEFFMDKALMVSASSTC